MSQQTPAIKPDKLTYKRHSVPDLFHKGCGEFVSGNGSYVMPYKCSCGEWEYDIDKYDWRLKQ